MEECASPRHFLKQNIRFNRTGRKVSKHFLQLLGKSTEEDLMDWNIFPELNGTLILENEKRGAQINLADKEYSYFKDFDNHLEGDNHIILFGLI